MLIINVFVFLKESVLCLGTLIGEDRKDSLIQKELRNGWRLISGVRNQFFNADVFNLVKKALEGLAVMHVSGIHSIAENPSVFITRGLDSVCEDFLVLSLMEPSAFGVRRAGLDLFSGAASGASPVVIVIPVLEGLFPMCFAVRIDFLTQHVIIETGFLLGNPFLHLPAVCMGLYMRCINEHLGGIHQLKPVAFLQDPLEYLLEQVGVLEPSRIVLSEGSEVRDGISHLKAEEPAVGHVHLNLLDCLAHAPDTV